MKTFKVVLMAFVAILFFGCALMNVGYDQDNTVDFKQYKKFAWYIKDPTAFKYDEFDNQILESNIKNLVSGELKKRGYIVSVENPDLLLDYELMIERKVNQVQTPVYSHPYNYGYGYPNRPGTFYNNSSVIIGYQTQNIPYKDGTLTISMVDRKTNKLVWRGWGEEIVTDAQTYESQLPEGISEIFKQFPLPSLVTQKQKKK